MSHDDADEPFDDEGSTDTSALRDRLFLMNPVLLYRLADRPKGQRWQAILRDYNAEHRGPRIRWWIAWWWVVGIVGFAMVTSFTVDSTYRGLGCGLTVLAATRVSRINEHWDGFFTGYGEGRRDGVYAAFGVTKNSEIVALEREAFERMR